VLQLGVPVMSKSDNRYPDNWTELSNNIKELVQAGSVKSVVRFALSQAIKCPIPVQELQPG
jgi:hypothetical protein